MNKGELFHDALLIPPLASEKQTISGIELSIANPSESCDVCFAPAYSLKPQLYSHIAVLFAVDDDPERIPAFSMEFSSSIDSTIFCDRFDMRQKAFQNITEVGRILRGPSGTLSFPVYLVKLPIPQNISRALSTSVAPTLTLAEEKSSLTVFAVRPISWDGKAPYDYIPREEIHEAIPDEEIRKCGFTLKLTVDFSKITGETIIYDAPGALKVSIRDVDKNPAPCDYDARNGNYKPFRDAFGRCLILEALMPGPTGRIGLPLTILDDTKPIKEIVLCNDNVKWSILVDGKLDQDFPIRDAFWPSSTPYINNDVVVSYTFLKKASSDLIPTLTAPRKIEAPIQFWTPSEHNQWLGDVVLGYFKNTLHIFYLIDRRHHNSKAGRGGHWFEHLRSQDLVHWEELPTAVPMDERWEYIGTGTPLEIDGQIHLAYGLHTTREVSIDKTTYQEQQDYIIEHGEEKSIPFSCAELSPIGGTYSTSKDGVHFSKSHILNTIDQNPTIYRREDGRLGLAKIDSLWASDTLSGWRLSDDTIPTFGDCPCPFSWNGFHYLIQGFCTFAASKSGLPGTYEDWVLMGLDIYEGMSVPMVIPYKDNRRLYIGWINHPYGWGGWLCFRELIQYPDGRLGTKWLPEVTLPSVPATHIVSAIKPTTLYFTAASQNATSFAFTFDPQRQRSQFSTIDANGNTTTIPTLRELYGGKTPPKDRLKVGRRYRPDDGNDFAIENITLPSGPVALKLIQYYDKKADTTIFDIEIGSSRTMVTRRLGKYTTCTIPK